MRVLIILAHKSSPRGKLLGGSSSINGTAFVRGQSHDYDTWAQMGNRGWNYRDLLPFFKRMESYEGDGDDEFRGREASGLRLLPASVQFGVIPPEGRDPERHVARGLDQDVDGLAAGRRWAPLDRGH